MRKRRRLIKKRDASRGIAVVELAVCLPLVVTLLLGTIEACVMLQLKQNLTIAAYEGGRVGVIPGTDIAAVEAQCQLLLDDRNIQASTITMSPDPSTLTPGDNFTVTVAADCVSNAVVGGIFFQGRTITESVVMRAE